MTTTSTATKFDGFTARCARGHIVTGPWADVRAGWATCPCGAHGIAKGMTVTIVADKRCGVRCTSALGASCDCSCGGHRHGSDHAATGTL